MKYFCEALMVMAFFCMHIAVFGFGAFLIYKQADGWGWYLFVAALVVGSTSFKTRTGGKDSEERGTHVS
jgi:hypothetical protein